MVDTKSLSNLQREITAEGTSTSQVEGAPPTQKAEGEDIPPTGIQTLLDSSQDLAHKRSFERAISSNSQFRKKNLRSKLPSIP